MLRARMHRQSALKIMTNHFKLIAFCLCYLCVFSSASASEDAWFSAIKKGDEWALSGLLFKGTSINAVDKKGNTAAHLSAKAGDLNTLKWLLKQKEVDINRRNGAGETALMLALLEGHWGIANVLLDKGAQVNQVGWTPLHYAAASQGEGASGMVGKLVEDHAAYIDAESPNGTTPLMMAAQYGSPEAVRAFIEIGADVELKNQLGLTALDFAQRGERPDAIRYLSAKLEQLELARAKARAEAEAKAQAQALAEAQAKALAEKARLAEERAVKTQPIGGTTSGIEARALGAPSEASTPSITDIPRNASSSEQTSAPLATEGTQNTATGEAGGLIAPALALPKSAIPAEIQSEKSQAPNEPRSPANVPSQTATDPQEAPSLVPEVVFPRTPIVVPDSAFGKVVGPAPEFPTKQVHTAASKPDEPIATPTAAPGEAHQSTAGSSPDTPSSPVVPNLATLGNSGATQVKGPAELPMASPPQVQNVAAPAAPAAPAALGAQSDAQSQPAASIETTPGNPAAAQTQGSEDLTSKPATNRPPALGSGDAAALSPTKPVGDQPMTGTQKPLTSAAEPEVKQDATASKPDTLGGASTDKPIGGVAGDAAPQTRLTPSTGLGQSQGTPTANGEPFKGNW